MLRLLRSGDGCQKRQSTGVSKLASMSTSQSQFKARRSSLEWTLPCHGRDHGFKSHTSRQLITISVRTLCRRLVGIERLNVGSIMAMLDRVRSYLINEFPVFMLFVSNLSTRNQRADGLPLPARHRSSRLTAKMAIYL